MTRRLTKTLGCFCCFAALFVLLAPLAYGQSAPPEGSAILEGTVCDSSHRPLAAATVSLENKESAKTWTVQTDSEGRYLFSKLPDGSYTLSAKAPGFKDGRKEQLAVPFRENKHWVLLLERDSASSAAKNAPQTIEFSNETQFTVAGVTDPTNLGGHGSDVVLRTKEALARDTVSLEGEDIERAKQRVVALRGQEDNAELHALLAEIGEHDGRPLEAVREYQRAAEMDPSETNLFAWGAELLLHRALEPAAVVFAKGQQLFPRSVRMRVGLGVSSYARGANEQAVRQLLEASDLDPADASPYLFLGRIQDAEKIEPPGLVERLKRFSELQPESAKANYYYAVGLAKESPAAEGSGLIEALLKKAIQIDLKFGDAYLQLGILYAGQKEYPKAIAAYEKAIEYTAFPEQAHFRLAQVYRQTGEQQKARKEIEIYNQVAKEETDKAERDRHDIGQFVYTLRGQTTPARAPASAPQ